MKKNFISNHTFSRQVPRCSTVGALTCRTRGRLRHRHRARGQATGKIRVHCGELNSQDAPRTPHPPTPAGHTLGCALCSSGTWKPTSSTAPQAPRPQRVRGHRGAGPRRRREGFRALHGLPPPTEAKQWLRLVSLSDLRKLSLLINPTPFGLPREGPRQGCL